MKIKFILTLLLMQTLVFGQTYLLDETFGNGGMKYFSTAPLDTFNPSKGLLINSNYYLVGGNRVVKIDYDGNMATGFGTDGVLTPLPSNYDITKMAAVGNDLFLFGDVYASNTVADMFICKIDTNGVFDPTFGTNGKMVIDFGGNEIFGDFTFETSGKLYCVASGWGGTFVNNPILYFKVNTDGTLDTTFDAAGYKSMVSTQSNTSWSADFITPYNGGYLLVGSTGLSNELTRRLVLAKVDSDGNLMTDFGAGGIQSTSPIYSFWSIDRLENSYLYDNKLFLNTYGVSGFTPSQGYYLIYDLVNAQVISQGYSFYRHSFALVGDALFETGYGYCGSDGLCNSKFLLRKRQLNGTIDAGFQNNTDFTCQLPGSYLYANTRSKFFIRDDNGRFMIAAKSMLYPASTVGTAGLSLARIKEGVLRTDEAAASRSIAVFPNPFENEIQIDCTKPIRYIEIFDASGRQLATPAFEQNGNQAKVDLSALSVSTYLMKIRFEDDSILSQKIIKR